MGNRRKTGSEYEQKTAEHLESLGWKILERNYRCRIGEIDLIALDGRTLVFVEVKYLSLIHIFNDYSLSEVAEERGISRQGVHDLVKRCNKILQDYESKLHLVEKFVTIKEQIERMEASLLEAEQPDREELVRQLNGILENL